jgi:AAA domain-containing protein
MANDINPLPELAHNSHNLVSGDTCEKANLLAAARRKHGLRSYSDLVRRRRELGAGRWIVEGLIPARCITILVGNSGEGKTPLLYQQALCIAAGIDFLGMPVARGHVLVLDFENGLGESDKLIQSLASHLSISEVPAELTLWNGNDAVSQFGQLGYRVPDIITDWANSTGDAEKLVIIDSLGSLTAAAEEKNRQALDFMQLLRELNRKCGTTICFCHHRRKVSLDPRMRAVSLACCDNVREWFQEARGASALINAADVRLGLETVEHPLVEDAALVYRGFGRIRGEIGPFYLGRALDDEGNPLGYRKLTDLELLSSTDQQEAMKRLPEQFTFAEAKQAYGRQDQATADLLRKCGELGVVRKVSRGKYVKLAAQ